MARKPLMAGNLKMNLNHVEVVGLIQKLSWSLADRRWNPDKSECAIIPPFTSIRTAQIIIEGDRLAISHGAQDVSPHPQGAYTGDISSDMLAKLGCRYVIVGHSERRQYHHEDDALVAAKTRRCLESGLTPIICVGEGQDVRQAGSQVAYTVAQIKAALAGLSAEQVASLVVAYEPIWAIGTGLVATAEDAQEVCGAIRRAVQDGFGASAAESVRVLYGGSVKASNIGAIMSQPDVDGALVGGASLNPEEFALITRYYDLPDYNPVA